ncbi:hypothetical protein [Pseudomonas alabamensis]|uniref:hypothetical protein n=1 Tax=Pseudomonas alabamensis TaxID=3064349 RepID=UPI0021DA8F74|nr:hypothetical protein [Pseudomonas entomophila]
MIPHLRAKIEAVISLTESNTHLHALLIAGCKQTLLAQDLADALEVVTLSTERLYREYQEPANALMPHRERAWWQQTVAKRVSKFGVVKHLGPSFRTFCSLIAIRDPKSAHKPKPKLSKRHH